MDVFLFPLVNVTLFPRTTKPLNIFEHRYVEMVKDSVDSKTPIAIGFIDDPGVLTDVFIGQSANFVREIAGYGYPQLVEERSNGTQLIFLHGQGKVRLGKVKDVSKTYIVCEAEIIPENQVVLPEMQSRLENLAKILVRWITTHIPDPVQREIFIRNMTTPEEIVGAFAAYLVRDYDLQQMVLEFDSINDKIVFLHRLAESSETTSV